VEQRSPWIRTGKVEATEASGKKLGLALGRRICARNRTRRRVRDFERANIPVHCIAGVGKRGGAIVASALASGSTAKNREGRHQDGGYRTCEMEISRRGLIGFGSMRTFLARTPESSEMRRDADSAAVMRAIFKGRCARAVFRDRASRAAYRAVAPTRIVPAVRYLNHCWWTE